MNSLDTFASSWQHLHVLVLGLGDSGLAMARWCAARGASVQVADSRDAPPQAEALAREWPQATLHRGFDPSLLDGEVLRVLKSPGLSPLDPLVAPLLARAAELGIAVHGELDLFAEALAELKVGLGYAPKVIAITGTNGKTTTTMMCGRLVERSGARVAVAGNVGPTMLGTLAAALQQERAVFREAPVACEPPSPQPSPADAGEGVGRAVAQAEVGLVEPAAEADGAFIDDEADSLPLPLAGEGEGGGEGAAACDRPSTEAEAEVALLQAVPREAPAACEPPSPQPSPADAGEGAGRAVAQAEAGSAEPAAEAKASSVDPAAETKAGSVDPAADADVAFIGDEPDALPLPLAGEDGGEGAAACDRSSTEAEVAPLHLVPPPPPAPVFEHLPEVWVLELSSFQLEGVERFEPTAAVVLNLSQDHLDWHGSMAAYGRAKARIYGPADRIETVAIVNRDSTAAAALVPQPEPEPVPSAPRGSKLKLKPPAPRREIRFGLGAPRRPGDYGLVTENGMAWMVRAMEPEVLPKRRRGDVANAAPADDEPLALQRLMPADALRIRGRHNVGNALAALALATAAGRPLAPMLHGLREYRGEPHRVEFIADVGGVEAFDDSKGTNVGATVAALDGLGAERGPEQGDKRLWVILGGVGKGQDFAPLAAPLARWAKGVALIGRDAGVIEAAVGAVAAQAGVPVATHATLDAAVQWCFSQARSGDAVLLSPACASFDMFKDYAHRAQVFGNAVRALAHARGEAA